MTKWKKLSSELAFDTKWFKVRKDRVKMPNDKIIDDYYLWLSGDVALIVPVTENNEFILVKQYKYGANKEVIEFPAGFIDEKENPLDAAKRELKEETGYISNDFQLIAKNELSPTKSNGKVYIYLAKNSTIKYETSFDETENIELIKKSEPEILKMIDNNKISVSDSIAAFFIARRILMES
jgi:8-oxo-dGTP pyrophosphatase MutT (NUDIX family)